MSLLIHDHTDMIELLGVNLRCRGHRFHAARDLRGGLAHLRLCTHDRVLVHDAVPADAWPDLLALLPHGAQLSLWTGTWEPLPRIAREHPSVRVELVLGVPSLGQLLGALVPRRAAVAA